MATPPPATLAGRRTSEVAGTVAVLAVAWAVGIRWRDAVPVLWLALGAAALLGVAARVLQTRHGVRWEVGHDVWLALPAAAIHLAVSYVAIPVAEAIVPLIGDQAESLVFDVAGGAPTWLVAAIAGVVIAPLEELFWRGTVQADLGVGRPWWLAVAISTGAFMAFHVPTGQLPLISAAALGGLVWGWLRERTEGVAAPMLAHGMWTAAIVLVPPT